MTQTLEEFRTAFGCDPVRTELDAKYAKDGKPSYVFLKPITSADRDEFEAGLIEVQGKPRDLHNLRARLVCKSWVDEEGKPMGSAKQVGALRADFVGHLFEKVRLLNGMDESITEEAGKG